MVIRGHSPKRANHPTNQTNKRHEHQGKPLTLVILSFVVLLILGCQIGSLVVSLNTPTPPAQNADTSPAPSPVVPGTSDSQSASAISPANVNRVTQLSKTVLNSVITQIIWSSDGQRIGIAVNGELYGGSTGIYIYTGMPVRYVSFIDNSAEVKDWGTVLGNVYGIAFSPSGKVLASAQIHNQGTDVKLRDTTTGKELRRFPYGYYGWEAVLAVAFSPDGTILASGGKDKNVSLWDISTGKKLRVLTGHSSDIVSIAFSPDGKTIATSSSDQTVKLWNSSTGDELRTFLTDSPIVAFSPDWKTFAAGGNSLVVWDTANRQPRFILDQNYSQPYSAVAFSPDGKVLATGSGYKVVLWEVATGKELSTLVGHSGSVTTVAFSPDGKIIASGSQDKTLRVWGLR